MNAPVVTFFNSTSGSGKTLLTYHLAWVLADLGYRVLAVDLDPHADLTLSFIGEEELEKVWVDAGERPTVFGALSYFREGERDLVHPQLTSTTDERLVLLAGDPWLAPFEDDLSGERPDYADGTARELRMVTAIPRMLRQAAIDHRADIVIVDVGSNLGAITRTTLMASDHVVVPLAPDISNIQGLRGLGSVLRKWQAEEVRRNGERREAAGRMRVAGYVVLEHGVRLDRPLTAYIRWTNRIPGDFRSSLLGRAGESPRIEFDDYCLGRLKHYHSLMQMAQEARKPIFALTIADGAFGGHFQAARDAHGHFRKLAETLVTRIGGLRG